MDVGYLDDIYSRESRELANNFSYFGRHRNLVKEIES